MARRSIRQRDILAPDRILSNLLRDYVDGSLDDHRVLYRASVVEIDHIGGKLESIPVPNPRNSIKARIITDSYNVHTSDEDLPVFWPLFPYDVMPLKETEHVYVIFEDPDRKEHGLWITRIPEPNEIHSPNITPGIKKYIENPENELDGSTGAAERAVQDLDEDPGVVDVSEEFTSNEEVPLFKARVGDRVVEGSNNTVIVLGRDRPSDSQSGQINEAGTIDIVAGRKDDDDMNIVDDKSRIYVSMKTDIDSNLATKNDPGKVVDGKAAVILRSDEIRVVAREGMKIVVEGGDLHLEGANVFLGKDAVESVVQGDAFNSMWKKFLSQVSTHNHPSPVPNSPSPALASFATPVGQELGPPNNVLSKTVKTKG